jgi:quercetin dioxygenase-like cupin family protein
MTYISKNLIDEVTIPENGILSRTLHNDDALKVVIFGFAPGQELSAHTAPMPATIQILKGDATLTLGSEKVDASPGTFAFMPPFLNHAIVARTPTVMLLSMVKAARQEK